jgi:MoaA/NifB/PqqE/SkfB family radical SAM enzyme
LFHAANMEAIVKGQYLPPYWVATDPSNICNQACKYCNAAAFRKRSPGIMPGEHLLRLADFYRDWGIKSTVIEGGGEPLMGENVPQFLERLSRYDIQAGLVTNGSLMDEKYVTVLPNCARWVGLSVDAATSKTYRAIRGTDDFEQVIVNIKALCAHKKSLDVRMKLLIQPENYREIVEFVKIARDLGCTGAHIKPLTLENVEGAIQTPKMLPLDEINDLLARAREMQSETFDVDCITYKHDLQYKRIVKFSHCKCTPLGGVFAADGTFQLCYNMRGRKGMTLCNHYPHPWEVRRIWGTAHHKALVMSINPHDCMRCGLTQYNEIIENCIERDTLYRDFP